ncbi:MAG TPA: hypothetical protein VMB19_04550 [Silvibacterium sp.]|nr:hypothetical protein [Silvibacterium sp.]
MRSLKLLALPVLVAGAMWMATPTSPAQVSISIGPPPVCPYGYYDYPPYMCAPYGYYGPGWFSGGVFIGAGPWFHGHNGFYGHVDNHYDPRDGYHGPYPARGEHPNPQNFAHHAENFHGNEMRDGHGHVEHEGHGH